MPALIPSLCSGDPAQTGEMTGYTVPLELGEAGVCGRPNALIKNLAPLTPSREWVRWGRILVQMSAFDVRRDKAALFQRVQGPPDHHSRRKQPEQAWSIAKRSRPEQHHTLDPRAVHRIERCPEAFEDRVIARVDSYID